MLFTSNQPGLQIETREIGRDMLDASVESVQNGSLATELRELVAAWRTGNPDGLMGQLQKDTEDLPPELAKEYEEALYQTRNHGMSAGSAFRWTAGIWRRMGWSVESRGLYRTRRSKCVESTLFRGEPVATATAATSKPSSSSLLLSWAGLPFQESG